jgi:hypothetical protein
MGWQTDEARARALISTDPGEALVLVDLALAKAEDSAFCRPPDMRSLIELRAEAAELAGETGIAVAARQELRIIEAGE